MSRGVSQESNAAAERFIGGIKDGSLRRDGIPEQKSNRGDFDDLGDLISFRNFLDSQLGRITLEQTD